MSYTTMNRYGEVKHQYVSRKANGFVQGAWWPDFGPMSYDYSYQCKMHPTNTIFENVIDKYSESRRKQTSDVMAERMQDRFAGSAGSSLSTEKQFRRPLPATEALYKSTIIQPYKSGGRTPAYGKGKEGAWYEPPDLSNAPESPMKSISAQIEGTLARQRGANTMRRSASVPSPTAAAGRLTGIGRSALDSPTSSISSVRSGDQQQKPSWVASHTLLSREVGRAGHAGSPKMQGDMMRVKCTGSPTRAAQEC